MFVRYIGSAFWSHCDLQAAWRRVQSRLQASQQDHQAVRMQFTGCLCGTHYSVSGMRSLFADELDLQKKQKQCALWKLRMRPLHFIMYESEQESRQKFPTIFDWSHCCLSCRLWQHVELDNEAIRYSYNKAGEFVKGYVPREKMECVASKIICCCKAD